MPPYEVTHYYLIINDSLIQCDQKCFRGFKTHQSVLIEGGYKLVLYEGIFFKDSLRCDALPEGYFTLIKKGDLYKIKNEEDSA